MSLGAQTLAALGAAGGEHLLAVLRRHARAEPVAPFALQVAGLESPLGGHGSLPLIPSRSRGNYMPPRVESSTVSKPSKSASCDGFAICFTFKSVYEARGHDRMGSRRDPTEGVGHALSSQKETAGMPPQLSLSPDPGKCAGAEN